MSSNLSPDAAIETKNNKTDQDFEAEDGQGSKLNDLRDETEKNQDQNLLELENKVFDLENELKSTKLEIDDWKEKAFRLGAELQNLDRQNQIDLTQAKKAAKKSISSLMLNFLNTLNLSFSHIPQTEDKNIINFIQTLKSNFDKLIQDFKIQNIEIIAPSSEQVFDPETMLLLNPELLTEAKQPLIKQVVGVGLKVDGQLIQAASVMI